MYRNSTRKEANEKNLTVTKLNTAFGYLSLSCNILSCLILGLVLHFISKINRSVVSESGKEGGKKLNKLVTVGHIFIILGFSILSILIINFRERLSKNQLVRLRIDIAYVIFGAIADLFLSV